MRAHGGQGKRSHQYNELIVEDMVQFCIHQPLRRLASKRAGFCASLEYNPQIKEKLRVKVGKIKEDIPHHLVEHLPLLLEREGLRLSFSRGLTSHELWSEALLPLQLPSTCHSSCGMQYFRIQKR